MVRVIVAAAAMMIVTPAQAVGNTDAQVASLVARIRASVALVSLRGEAPVYEAQMASTIIGENASCEVVQQALVHGLGERGTPEANKALNRLKTQFARCLPAGTTGALAGSGAALSLGSSFTTGGGSSTNYVR